MTNIFMYSTYYEIQPTHPIPIGTLLSYALLVLTVLLLIGGIEFNPGPVQGSLLSNVKIVHNNVCSLKSKVDIIFNELCDFDVIGISESHLDRTISDEEIEFVGFHKPVRLDRNRFGGGVIIYVKNNLQFFIRNDLSNPNIEIIWLEIHCVNNKFLTGVMYRPPNSRAYVLDNLAISLENAIDTGLPIFLMGDFNIDMLVDGNQVFKHMLQNFSLTNVITQPTNYTTTRGTCIDLIITNAVERIENIDVLTPFCSTHSPVTLEIHFKTYKQRAYRRILTDYAHADYTSLNSDLLQVNWDRDVFNSTNINDVYKNFTDIFTQHVNQHIPKKVVVIRPSDKPFMTNAIRRKMRQHNRIHYKAK